MGIISYLEEKLRPELPVKQDVLSQEKKFNESNPNRESWVLNHVYLCEGGLAELARHPDFNTADKRMDCVETHYAPSQYEPGPCRKVIVSIPLGSDRKTIEHLVKIKLKIDLHNRGCNAGVSYRQYEKNNSLYAEAIPATLFGK